MARIAGVNIPNHKHTEIALTAIFGIGRLVRSRSVMRPVLVAPSRSRI